MTVSVNIVQIDVGESIGGCTITKLIGRGGMGAVYEAHQESLDRRVAVKIHHFSDNASSEGAEERFLREARLAAKLNHPNIVQIFDIGQADDVYFMIMEYVEGVTLKDLTRKQTEFPIDRLYRVAVKVARGLAAAHKENIVHRDIKPENVMLTSSGEVKITDFGAASFLLSEDDNSEGLIGTPLYMAPEVILRQPNDGRADVYALGLILYTAAAGAHPFRDRDLKKVIRAQVQSPLKPLVEKRPTLNEKFAELIQRLCAKKTYERCDADELLKILEDHPDWETPVAPTRDRPASRPAPASGSEAPAANRSNDPVLAPATSILGAGLVRDRRRRDFGPNGPAAVSQEHGPEKKTESSAKQSVPKTVSAQTTRKQKQEDPRAAELCVRARFQIMKKRWQNAGELFSQALEIDPRSETALLGLARVLTEQELFGDAVELLRRAFQMGNVSTAKILESHYFARLRDCKEFRRLMAEYSL